MRHTIIRYASVALLIVGSATLLFSCEKKATTTVHDYETLMTESSENRTITMMENGMRSYIFEAPLVEGYSMATNPYQEFRRGVKMTTFTNDSLQLVDVTLTANYAIYYENQKLWEAKGNVVIHKRNRKEGDTTVTGLTEVYTQQLFWNAKTKKVYSNVDTKVLQPDGWHFGVGFDADEDLKNIHFRKYSSEMEFDMSQPAPRKEPTDEGDEQSAKGDKGAKGGQSDKGGKGDQRGQSDKQRAVASSSAKRGSAPQRPADRMDGNPKSKTQMQRPSADGRAPRNNELNPNVGMRTATRPGQAEPQTKGVQRAAKQPATASKQQMSIMAQPNNDAVVKRTAEQPAQTAQQAQRAK